MTMTRFVFAVTSSVYLLIAIPLEERSLRRLLAAAPTTATCARFVGSCCRRIFLRRQRAAAWLLTALFAIAVSASVFRIPIQVSDSVEILEAVDRTPSVAAAFTQGLHGVDGRCCGRCGRR